jgi:hypothetical protein
MRGSHIDLLTSPTKTTCSWSICYLVSSSHFSFHIFSHIFVHADTSSSRTLLTSTMDYTKLDPEASMELAPFFARLARIRTAHGVIMPLAIIIWFPLGVFLLRLLKTTNMVRWHAIWQCIGLALLLSGFGLGGYLSNNSGVSPKSRSYIYSYCKQCGC